MGGQSIHECTPLHREWTETVSMIGGDFLHDSGEGWRVSSTVVGQLYKMGEVVLLEFKHDVTHQVHANSWGVHHLGHHVMETGSNEHNGILDIASQRGSHTMEDVHSNRPPTQLLYCHVSFSQEMDVLQGKSQGIS